MREQEKKGGSVVLRCVVAEARQAPRRSYERAGAEGGRKSCVVSWLQPSMHRGCHSAGSEEGGSVALCCVAAATRPHVLSHSPGSLKINIRVSQR